MNKQTSTGRLVVLVVVSHVPLDQLLPLFGPRIFSHLPCFILPWTINNQHLSTFSCFTAVRSRRDVFFNTHTPISCVFECRHKISLNPGGWVNLARIILGRDFRWSISGRSANMIKLGWTNFPLHPKHPDVTVSCLFLFFLPTWKWRKGHIWRQKPLIFQKAIFHFYPWLWEED